MRISALEELKLFLTPVALDDSAKQYFDEQYFKHAAMTVKYALAAAAVMLYFDWPDAEIHMIMIWGAGSVLFQLGRYLFATKALAVPESRFKQLFYIVEVLAVVWWVAYLFLLGGRESETFLVLWRASLIFIIVTFYLDTMRYSKFALLTYSLLVCAGTFLYMNEFALISDDMKLRGNVILLFGTAIVLMFGRSSHVLSYGIYKIIAQNKQLVLARDEMLVHDELTKQHNRRYFDTQLSRYLSLFQRNADCFSVALLDIDYFKNVNDTHGHAVGDEVLIKLSASIKDKLRTSGIFARYGGEEFVMLLPTTELKRSEALLNRLKLSVASQIFKVNGIDIALTISVGATIVQHGDTAEVLLARADKALYQAKKNGRNQVVVI